MPLPAGARLGPYEVVAPAGAGGMGEVTTALRQQTAFNAAISSPDPVRTLVVARNWVSSLK